MVVDPNSFRAGYFAQGVVEQPDPSFFDTLGASLGYSYAPAYNTLTNSFRYNPQKGYDWRQDLEGYELFATDLNHAVSPQHMSKLKQDIEDSISRRQVLQNSSMLSQLGAGLFDPINLVALPFGGPAIGVGRSALRVGAGTAALELGLELTRQSDPLQTAQEGALNVLAAGAFGAGFGAAFGGVNARAYAKTKQGIQEEFDMIKRLDRLEGVTTEQISVPRTERRFGNDSDEYLQAQLDMFESSAARSEADAIAYEGKPEAAQFEADAKEQRAYAQQFKNEQGIRELEARNIDLTDPYRIMNTLYTDSFLYKAVTTPVKRLLQSKYPSAIKEATVRSFGDSGITLALNSVGLASPQSVAQRAAVSNGKWVRAHDEMIKLWTAETGAANISRLDINVTDIVRRASRADNTYRKWLTTVSEKRIKNIEDLTDNERKAIGVINKYFKDAGERLEDVGLIGTAKGVSRRIENFEAKIEDLNARLARAERKKTTRSQLEANRIKGELDRIGGKLAVERQTLQGLEEVKINPANEDVFFPRFWSQSAVKKNRNEFSQILYNWYKQNPFIYEFDSKTSTYVKTELSSEPSKIQERVDLTIDRILGEQDPTNVDNIGFGVGRSKHFRHRELDIPNKLVTDFMVTDPLAVMKTYATRIEPRYEYAKAFGQDVDGVLFDLESEMITKGFSEKDINKMRRDYLHMYERTAGAVIRNPDSLSQKAAFILREAASFSYMGSAGLAALPDFGRIVMEHDAENVMKGIQAIMDKNTVNLTANEIRYAGEAIDILRGSAHMRLMEDLSNNVDASDLLSNARNAFYIMNGLAPMTGIAKQLAGIVDAHTIIDYSIRYTELTPQELTWLSRYGIGAEDAAKIAKAPWQKSDNNLYMANTDEWTNISLDNIIEETRKTYKRPKPKLVSSMTEKDLLKRYGPEFFVDRIITDPKIVQDVTERTGFKGALGLSVGFKDGMPNTIYIDPVAIKKIYELFKSSPKEKNEMLQRADRLLAEGKITEEIHVHRSQLIKNADLIDSADDYYEFILLHELHHTTNLQKIGETIPQYEKRIDEIAYAYIRNQKEEGIKLEANKKYDSQLADAEETVLKFRTALNSGVLNTIMSATPADKPIITDGVVYIPAHIGRSFGFKEDPKFKGYTRIENGFIGLPFQFYSYMLANVNKTIGALAQGQVKNRMLGITASMGLAYMSLAIRTPDFAWEEMGWRDRFARSFDMSGVMALYSDILYTSLHTSLALGGPNITNGLISPKFPQEPNAIDALTGVAGAGPSWAADTISGIYQFANGEYGEGGKQVVRNLPFGRMWFLKDDINQITRAWAQ